MPPEEYAPINGHLCTVHGGITQLDDPDNDDVNTIGGCWLSGDDNECNYIQTYVKKDDMVTFGMKVPGEED